MADFSEEAVFEDVDICFCCQGKEITLKVNEELLGATVDEVRSMALSHKKFKDITTRTPAKSLKMQLILENSETKVLTDDSHFRDHRTDLMKCSMIQLIPASGASSEGPKTDPDMNACLRFN